MKRDLFKLCEFNGVRQKLKLLYRGTLHGFRASTFHAKCDNIPKTLTVVKAAESGNIFGGYTAATWDEPIWGTCYKKDANAFLFSLVNKEKMPVKVNIDKGQEMYAIKAKSSYGPTFGILSSAFSIDLDKYLEYESFQSISSQSTREKFRIEDIEVFHVE
jgi:hypothetical protein